MFSYAINGRLVSITQVEGRSAWDPEDLEDLDLKGMSPYNT
jgi:hypothetical protein